MKRVASGLADGGSPIYRERVYCYELYHQMRSRWPPTQKCPFYLNGEVDKKAHPILSKLDVKSVPDFLVHGPGDMKKIEVKNSNVSNDGIASDLKKLALFVNKVGYQRAINLVYGEDANQQVERIGRIAGSISDLPQIELWIHQQLGRPAECATILGANRQPKAALEGRG